MKWRGAGNSTAAVEQMMNSILHRGPDAGGVWSDDEKATLGHRRLAILDLSEHGHQPMLSRSGRFVMVYNGEVYNYLELRKELEAADSSLSWRGHSDTEVIITAIEAWGLAKTLERLTGMFAIALWDRENSTLSLARDRLGEKPLYYGVLNDSLIFASELKAFKAAFKESLEISRESLAQFMRFGYVPAPHSIYKDIYKLPPGHSLTLHDSVKGTPVAFWQFDQQGTDELAQRMRKSSVNEVTDLIEARLRDAVSSQLVADVPVGAFLSGGIDSSLVVSLMKDVSLGEVNTYTIGFEDKAFDEAPYAKAIAEHLGTRHTEFYVTPQDAERLIPKLPEIYDEPFADSSQIPTSLVSSLTRQHVTVALSGDGGDELFAGYPRYQTTAGLWQTMSNIPMPVRHIAAGGLRCLSERSWDRVCSALTAGKLPALNGRRIYRMSELLSSTTLGQMYTGLMSKWTDPGSVVLGVGKVVDTTQWPVNDDPVEAMRRWDLKYYLPDDLLVKVDRAAMHASLETRAPMLDFKVAELALATPVSHLIRDGVGKYPLRQVLARHVPVSLFERPKAGFSIPLANWLRGPLRAWAEDLLSPSRLEQEGFFDVRMIRQVWEEHQQQRFDRSLLLWNVLMFQAWLNFNNQ